MDATDAHSDVNWDEIDLELLKRPQPLIFHPLLALVLMGVPLEFVAIALAMLFSPFSILVELAPLTDSVAEMESELFSVRRPWTAFVVGQVLGLVFILIGHKVCDSDTKSEEKYFRKDRCQMDVRAILISWPFLRMFFFQMLAIAAPLGVGYLFKLSLAVTLAAAGAAVFFVDYVYMSPYTRIEKERRRLLALHPSLEGDESWAKSQYVIVALVFVVAYSFVGGVAYWIHTTLPLVQELSAGGYHMYGYEVVTREDAEAMDERLEAQPTDQKTRVMLIGYYRARYVEAKDAGREPDMESASAAERRHVFWFLEHRPVSPYTAGIQMLISPRRDGAVYEQGKEILLGHLEESPEDVRLLWFTARYVRRVDDVLAEELLLRGQALAPDELRWAEELMSVRARRSRLEKEE